jgi:3-oxoacyl-[acyl-carrier protein] reductase
MTQLLIGKRALVTGGSQGIGAAIALGLGREGANVLLSYRSNRAAAERVATSIEALGVRATTHQGDAADPKTAEAAVRAAIEALGGLDILVCNAGIAKDSVSWKMSDESWSEVLNVNLGGSFYFAREAARVFREQKAGRIVFVSSINGIRGKVGQANYAASKGGQIALCKTLARELARFDVTVNVVAPGMVMTAMSRGLPEEVVACAKSEAVLGRLTEPEDVANAVVFLASDRARQITGMVLRVDGGQCI